MDQGGVPAGSDRKCVQQLPEHVYAALTEPWETQPHTLIAAVNAARVMQRAQVRTLPCLSRSALATTL